MATACIKSSLSAPRLSKNFSTSSIVRETERTATYLKTPTVSCVQKVGVLSKKRSAPRIKSLLLGLGTVGGLRMSGVCDLLRVSPSTRKRVSAARITAAVPFLPPTFGYVALTAAASLFLVQWQVFQVAGQRRKAGLAYPATVEDKEDSVFNCYQRAHQNTLESYPQFLALLLLAGLAYPITASALGAVWIFGRLLYSLGYYTGNPNNRHRGSFHWFGLWGLGITSIVFGVKQLQYLPL